MTSCIASCMHINRIMLWLTKKQLISGILFAFTRNEPSMKCLVIESDRLFVLFQRHHQTICRVILHIFGAIRCPHYILTCNLTLDIQLSCIVLAANMPLKQIVIHCENSRISSILATYPKSYREISAVQ